MAKLSLYNLVCCESISTDFEVKTAMQLRNNFSIFLNVLAYQIGVEKATRLFFFFLEILNGRD